MANEERIEKLIEAINILDARLKEIEAKKEGAKPDEPQNLRERLQADRAERVAQNREENTAFKRRPDDSPTPPRRHEIMARHTTLGPPPQRAKNAHPKPNLAFFPLDFYCYHEGEFSKVTIMATSAPTPIEI